ncbi:hypothetical protein LguiA_012495 [Lonicera macranthoides]
MQSAAKEAILYLKDKFNFEVQDINLTEMHYYIWCYNELDRDFNKLFEENKKLKNKIAKYKDILGTIDEDTQSCTNQNF